MKQLEKATQYAFHENGCYHLLLDKDCTITVDEHIYVQLYLTYDKEQADQKLKLMIKQDAKADMLFLADKRLSGSLHHHIQVMKDASVNIGYGELEAGSMDGKIICDLMESGAKAKLLHTCLADEHKHFQITCNHLQPHTEGRMENYAVVSENGDYQMEACGKIVKGAYGSASHQHTHVLTMSEHHRSEVIPLLLIDENDVEASHAMSLGQPDREQLYYLQSRGLSHKQALGLLMLGYIMPLGRIISDEELQKSLQELIEKKVGLYA